MRDERGMQADPARKRILPLTSHAPFKDASSELVADLQHLEASMNLRLEEKNERLRSDVNI